MLSVVLLHRFNSCMRKPPKIATPPLPPNKIEAKSVKKVAQQSPKMEPPPQEQLYLNNELENGFTKFLDVLAKIKTELIVKTD